MIEGPQGKGMGQGGGDLPRDPGEVDAPSGCPGAKGARGNVAKQPVQEAEARDM